MQQKPKTCLKIKQWWHETHILPSKLSKLVNLRYVLCTHTQKKTIIFGASLIIEGQENSPDQPGDADDGSMRSTQER